MEVVLEPIMKLQDQNLCWDDTMAANSFALGPV